VAESPKMQDLSSLTIDDLMKLYERVGAILATKLEHEKRKLEDRLAKLSHRSASEQPRGRGEQRRTTKPRRGYPPVLPKFRNPADPTQTWAGRGKQPRWLASQIKAGKKVADFLIGRPKRRAKR
jgi:DNA-binding protein H-NS